MSIFTKRLQGARCSSSQSKWHVAGRFNHCLWKVIYCNSPSLARRRSDRPPMRWSFTMENTQQRQNPPTNLRAIGALLHLKIKKKKDRYFLVEKRRGMDIGGCYYEDASSHDLANSFLWGQELSTLVRFNWRGTADVSTAASSGHADGPLG